MDLHDDKLSLNINLRYLLKIKIIISLNNFCKEEQPMSFTLDPQLKKDTLFIKDLELSALLLMNDSRFPWFILVPRRPDLKEIFQLQTQDQQMLWQEINSISKQALHFFKADKMNIAALGNIVPQLHIHVIARHKTDAAWPKPVWGMGQATPYPDSVNDIIAQMKEVL